MVNPHLAQVVAEFALHLASDAGVERLALPALLLDVGPGGLALGAGLGRARGLLVVRAQRVVGRLAWVRVFGARDRWGRSRWRRFGFDRLGALAAAGVAGAPALGMRIELAADALGHLIGLALDRIARLADRHLGAHRHPVKALLGRVGRARRRPGAGPGLGPRLRSAGLV